MSTHSLRSWEMKDLIPIALFGIRLTKKKKCSFHVSLDFLYMRVLQVNSCLNLVPYLTLLEGSKVIKKLWLIGSL